MSVKIENKNELTEVTLNSSHINWFRTRKMLDHTSIFAFALSIRCEPDEMDRPDSARAPHV